MPPQSVARSNVVRALPGIDPVAVLLDAGHHRRRLPSGVRCFALIDRRIPLRGLPHHPRTRTRGFGRLNFPPPSGGRLKLDGAPRDNGSAALAAAFAFRNGKKRWRDTMAECVRQSDTDTTREVVVLTRAASQFSPLPLAKPTLATLANTFRVQQPRINLFSN